LGWTTQLLPCIICPSRHSHTVPFGTARHNSGQPLLLFEQAFEPVSIYNKDSKDVQIQMSVNLPTEGNLDNTLGSAVNHVSFDQNHNIHEQKDYHKLYVTQTIVLYRTAKE